MVLKNEGTCNEGKGTLILDLKDKYHNFKHFKISVIQAYVFLMFAALRIVFLTFKLFSVFRVKGILLSITMMSSRY